MLPAKQAVSSSSLKSSLGREANSTAEVCGGDDIAPFGTGSASARCCFQAKPALLKSTMIHLSRASIAGEPRQPRSRQPARVSPHVARLQGPLDAVVKTMPVGIADRGRQAGEREAVASGNAAGGVEPSAQR